MDDVLYTPDSQREPAVLEPNTMWLGSCDELPSCGDIETIFITVNERENAYTVPSSMPVWMLVFWGVCGKLAKWGLRSALAQRPCVLV